MPSHNKIRSHTAALILIALTCFFSVHAQAAVLTPLDTYVQGDLVKLGPRPVLDGPKLDIAKFRGKKTVVLAFWLNACDLCMNQIKKTDAFLKKNNRSKDTVLITVNRGVEEEMDFIRASIIRNKLKLPVMIDPDIVVSRLFSISAVPSYVIIDRSGKLASPVMNHVDRKLRDYSLFQMIDLVRAGKKVPRLEQFELPNSKKLKSRVGTIAPMFSGVSIETKKVSLKESLSSGNVILVFWSAYDPVCEEVVRIIANFSSPANRKKYGFSVISLAAAYNQSQTDQIKEVMESINSPFPVVHDKGITIGRQFGVERAPTVFVLNRSGRIVDVVEMSKEKLSERLTAALENQK